MCDLCCSILPDRPFVIAGESLCFRCKARFNQFDASISVARRLCAVQQTHTYLCPQCVSPDLPWKDGDGYVDRRSITLGEMEDCRKVA
jgi:hypothetical protein